MLGSRLNSVFCAIVLILSLAACSHVEPATQPSLAADSIKTTEAAKPIPAAKPGLFDMEKPAYVVETELLRFSKEDYRKLDPTVRTMLETGRTIPEPVFESLMKKNGAKVMMQPRMRMGGGGVSSVNMPGSPWIDYMMNPQPDGSVELYTFAKIAMPDRKGRINMDSYANLVRINDRDLFDPASTDYECYRDRNAHGDWEILAFVRVQTPRRK